MTSSGWLSGGWPTSTPDRWSGLKWAPNTGVCSSASPLGLRRQSTTSAPSVLSLPEPSILPAPLYPVSRHHLDVLSDELGVWQHTSLECPDPAFGYCTDDVSRALSVDLLHSRELGWGAVAASVRRHLTFIEQAAGAPGRRFRNFRAADGAWLEVEGSEDCHGRTMASLAFTM